MSKHAVIEKEVEEEAPPRRRPAPNDIPPEASSTDAPVQQAAALPTISAFKPVENAMGVKSSGATTNPGIGVLQATKPVGMVANGGIPVLASIILFNGGGTSQYVPMPQGSIIVSVACLVAGNPAASALVKLGNDNTAGTQDIATITITTGGVVTLVLGSVGPLAGTTGSSLQITTPTDATLSGALIVMYLPMH